MRMYHESQLYQDNCFVTLTYDNTHLPPSGSLDYTAPVLFMKRLRKKFGADIRSYGCAEYGDQTLRPHYHLCIFNHDFRDKKIYKKNHENNSLFNSDSLSNLWPFGHAVTAELTFDSAAYVARYVTKKITGKHAQNHYTRHDPISGEIYELAPERSVCVSRRPGIGKSWYLKWGQQSYSRDYVILRGQRMKPPKYYDRLFELDSPEHFEILKAKRKITGEEAAQKLLENDLENRRIFYLTNPANSRWPKTRLQVMKLVQDAQFKQLKRGFENGHP